MLSLDKQKASAGTDVEVNTGTGDLVCRHRKQKECPGQIKGYHKMRS